MHSIDYVFRKQRLHFSSVCYCFIFKRYPSYESHVCSEHLDQCLKITICCLALEPSSSCLVDYYRKVSFKIAVL